MTSLHFRRAIMHRIAPSALLTLWVVACLAAPAVLRAQDDMPPGGGPPGGPPDGRIRPRIEALSAEAACFPSDTAGQARVDLLLRAAYDFMVFTRTQSTDPDSLFTAGIEYVITLRTPGGRAVATVNGRGTVAAGSYDSTRRTDRTLFVRRRFHVPPGEYTADVRISDLQSTNERLLPFRIRALAYDSARVAIGAPVVMAATRAEGAASARELAGEGASLRYAERAILLVPATFSEEGNWHFRLTALTPGEPGEPPEDAGVAFDGALQPRAVLPPMAPGGPEGLVEHVMLEPVPAGRGALHIFVLPSDTLSPGLYRLDLTVTTGEGGDSISMPLRIVWRDMPASLRDVTQAVRWMRHILTEEQYDSMCSGSTREQEQAFRAYWRANDPTPATPYNELMTEYFRRVDQANERFSTIYTSDGALTDRGKILILYGEPDDVERALPPDGQATETWTYKSLGKTFHFVDKNRDRNLKLAP